MKKRMVVFGTLVAVVIGLLGYSHFRTGVTRANYLRISSNMTKAEITARLGGPLDGVQWGDRLPTGGVCEWWDGDSGSIWLVYDEHDKIVWKEWKERGIIGIRE